MSNAKKSLVSIIIPCYNAERWVAEAIQSCLAQTYQPIEVIVIDDGSTDRSLEVIKSFGNKVRWETGPNRGGGAARNRGIKLATGEFVKFLDADDVLLKNCIETQITIALGCPLNICTYGIALDFDNKTPVFDFARVTRMLSLDDSLLACYRNTILTSAPLHRRSNLETIGGFDVSLGRGQEWNLHIRLVLSGVRFDYSSIPIYYYRNHESPTRISNQMRGSESIPVHVATYKATARAIRNYYRGAIPKDLRLEIYLHFHGSGRELVRSGRESEALDLFIEARKYYVKTKRVGKLLYRLLCYALGPIAAERLLVTLKNAAWKRNQHQASESN